MGKDSISFLHLGDTHFGVHYALRPKNLHRRAYGELFFQKVEEVINKAISFHKVDFILHSGDFFNRSSPPPEVVDRGVKLFQFAAKKGIPIYIVPGNHERSKLPLGLIPYSESNIKLFLKPCSYIFKKNGITIKITGFPYVRHNAKEKFASILKRASLNTIGDTSKNIDYSILVIHQLIEGSRIENYTFRKGNDIVSFFQIPTKINYVACGHIHRFQFLYNQDSSFFRSTNKFYNVKQDYIDRSWQFDDQNAFNLKYFQNPVISYSGSLDRVSVAEKNEPKGYIIGKLHFLNANATIKSADFQFHEVTPVKMIYCVWDLSRAPMEHYITPTLEKLYRVHSTYSPSLNQGTEILRGIFRIKIKGNREYNSKSLEYLKQEAKRLNVYLSFSYRPNLA